jgi:hypothetical protein
VVKSYLLPVVDDVKGGFPEELLLRMPLLDLRKKTEQSGEEVLMYVCVYLLLISSSYIFVLYLRLSLSLSL